MIIHKPVLLKESVDYLVTNSSGIYYDATIGFGSHSKEIIKRLDEEGVLIGVDKDINAINYCKELFATVERVRLFNTKFSDIDTISKMEFVHSFDGIFADLGVSSFQLDNTDAGFTYREEAPLDLRMDKREGITAEKVINSFKVEDLVKIFKDFGEERKSKMIAENIIRSRKIKPIKTTTDLKTIIGQIIPEHILMKSLSRIFQALRIYVNRELDELKELLEKSVDLLKSNGRIVVISYHSLEDRIVKEHFKYESISCVCPPEFPVCRCNKKSRLKILTKKPLRPKEDEIRSNKRARSAKLRAAQKI